MSMHIDDILCSHLLYDDKLKKILEKCEYYYISPHYILHIKDSIHYNTLTSNDYDLYEHLIQVTQQKEHSVNNFKKLINNFSLNSLGKIKIRYEPKLNKYIIQDGLHRLSILYHNNMIKNGEVPLKLLNINIDNATIDKMKSKVFNTVGNTSYNGWNNRTNYGYHSFDIYNFKVTGQRVPVDRLKIINQYISFKDKTVIDLGCNTGGMLLHTPELKCGYGIDYDIKCIESANYFKNILKYNNTLVFSVIDLNNFNVHDFMISNNIKQIDIFLILSLGSWVKNWETLYTETYKYSDIIILETNNDEEGKPQLDLFETFNANIKLISNASLDDTTGNHGRKLYLISKYCEF